MPTYCAVRCPGCLLTIYTVWSPSPERMKGFSVTSLSDENLAFYNCPFPLCEYHVNTTHGVNLYSDVSIPQKINVSAGFAVVSRTPHTVAFRSKLQVDALAIKLGITEDPPIKTPMPEAQVGEKAQPPKIPGEKDGPGGAPGPAVAQDVRVPRINAGQTNPADCSDPTKERNRPWAEVGGRRDRKGQAYGQ